MPADETLPPFAPADSEIALTAVLVLVTVTVAVVSYRRSRLLSDYPVWKAVAIAVVAGYFWPIWVVASLVNRERLAREWAAYRRDRLAPST